MTPTKKRDDHKERVDNALRYGLEDFWRRVAQYFPEINTGDYDPLETKRMEDQMRDHIEQWVAANMPKTLPQIAHTGIPQSDKLECRTATAGDGGTATAGDRGTATAGNSGEIRIRYWDGKRYRTRIGYIGEDGLEPNKKYRLNADAKFEEVKP